MSQPLTVGTAGHIDHGKTALVQALTGRNTDRLPEEKQRGISIELGYAELDLGERRLSLVDVPGHERFVRTMIAGASGIDLFLMTIAADDGVMPQTREHASVLRALGVDSGVIALTKCDLIDATARRRAAMDASALLPGIPIVEVSSHTGEGLTALRTALAAAAEGTGEDSRHRNDIEEPVVLHVDRVFTIAGHGTVVTGTLWSGTVRRGDRLELLPDGQKARVRQIQVHDRRQEVAGPRQRVALNLTGIKRNEIRRGDVVTGIGSALCPSRCMDVVLSCWTEEPKDNQRVQVHHGTRETPARVVRRVDGTTQLRLEAPLVAMKGDRFVIRRIAPPDTIGGGTVIDADPRRRSTSESENSGQEEPGRKDMQKGIGTVEPSIRLKGHILKTLQADAAMPRGSMALARTLEIDHDEAVAALESLRASGDLVRVKPDVYYPPSELESLTRQAVALIREHGSITIAEARDALKISRKYAQALLGYLDSVKVTIRRGDHRSLRQSYLARGS
ncbi:MAG: selenocysteine-specific translation elongation factor [Actinomycetota bacterium]|nr:selenocysteine-specific translation elongation factor [Actinomycetota bacterium]